MKIRVKDNRLHNIYLALFSVLLSTSCAGIDPGVVDEDLMNPAGQNLTLEKAADYAEKVANNYNEATIVLSRFNLGFGGLAIALGGATAGAGAAEVGGNVVTSLGVAAATMFGFDEFLQTQKKKQVYAAGRDAIQCSVAVTMGFGPEHSSSEDFLINQNAVNALENKLPTLNDYLLDLQQSPSDMFENNTFETLSLDFQIATALSAVALSNNILEVANLAVATFKRAEALDTRIEAAKNEAPRRLVAAVNAIRSRVTSEIDKLEPSLEDIKKLAAITVPKTNQTNIADANKVMSDSKTIEAKMSTMGVVPLIDPDSTENMRLIKEYSRALIIQAKGIVDKSEPFIVPGEIVGCEIKLGGNSEPADGSET